MRSTHNRLRNGPEVDPGTVAGSLLRACARWPDNLALVFGDRQASYSELWLEVENCASALMAHGVRPGANIGLYMPNCWQYVVLFYAINAVGACPVALNARFREHDLAYGLKKTDISVLFVSGHEAGGPDGIEILERAVPGLAGWCHREPLHISAFPKLRLVVTTGTSLREGWPNWSGFLEASTDLPPDALHLRMAAVSPGDDCLIMFSSGTTANPKACRLSHRALELSGAGMAQRFHLTQNDRFWDPLPMFHMSTMLPITACRQNGACFIGVERFEPSQALSELERLQVTIAYPAFATITAAMVSHPDFGKRDLSAIRAILNVGPVDLLRRFQNAFPQAVQVSCYGLTECGGLSFYNDIDEPLHQRLTTCGRPIGGVEARIVDLASGIEVDLGCSGEIQLRGTTLFSGYYDDEMQTDAAMTADGWLRTGDIGTLDQDQRITYLGRFKDMLRVGGENVAAAEIESYLATHPAIKLAQVIGVPDDRLEEVPAAFIELEPGAALTETDLIRFCGHKIATYKIPRYIRFVSDWPMSATKIQKFRLAKSFVPERKIDLASILKEGQRL